MKKSLYAQRSALTAEILALNTEITIASESWTHDEVPREKRPKRTRSRASTLLGSPERHCTPDCETCAFVADRFKRLTEANQRLREINREIVNSAASRAWRSGKNASQERAKRQGHVERDRLIMQKHESGKSAAAIKRILERTLKVTLTPQRINQIIRKLKA